MRIAVFGTHKVGKTTLTIKPMMINGVEHHWYKFESEKTINQKKRRSLGTYDITSGEYRN